MGRNREGYGRGRSGCQKARPLQKSRFTNFKLRHYRLFLRVAFFSIMSVTRQRGREQAIRSARTYSSEYLLPLPDPLSIPSTFSGEEAVCRLTRNLPNKAPWLPGHCVTLHRDRRRRTCSREGPETKRRWRIPVLRPQ